MPLFDKTPSSISYDLYTQSLKFGVEKEDFHAPLTPLYGYSMGEATTDAAAKVQIPVVVERGGQQVTFFKTVRAEYVRNYTFEIGFPPGNWLRGPLSNLVRNLANCTKHFYMVQMCPDTRCKEFYLWLPEGRMSALVPGQLMTVEEDAVPITATSNLEVIEPKIGYYLEAELLQDGANAIYGAAFCEEECVDCGEVCKIGVYAGAAETVYTTTDGFASGDATVITLPGTGIITSVYCHGDLIYGTWTDNIVPATAADGGVFYSMDGVNYTVLDFNNGMFDISPAANINYSYLAVGSAGMIRGSVDLQNWTTITNTVFAAGDFRKIAYDFERGVGYIAGDDGTTAPAAIEVTGTRLVDITADVTADVTSVLTAVAVLGKGHVMFGDDTGDLFEAVDIENDSVFVAIATPTSAVGDPVGGIAGDRSRIIIGSGTIIYERSPLTGRDVTALTIAGGVELVGNITDVAMCTSGTEIFPGPNNFIVVTDAGEIVSLKPCPPNWN